MTTLNERAGKALAGRWLTLNDAAPYPWLLPSRARWVNLDRWADLRAAVLVYPSSQVGWYRVRAAGFLIVAAGAVTALEAS
jgi:hypothetical protein